VLLLLLLCLSLGSLIAASVLVRSRRRALQRLARRALAAHNDGNWDRAIALAAELDRANVAVVGRWIRLSALN
jgi:hypothetical protein